MQCSCEICWRCGIIILWPLTPRLHLGLRETVPRVHNISHGSSKKSVDFGISNRLFSHPVLFRTQNLTEPDAAQSAGSCARSNSHRVHLINLFLTPSFLFHLFWITGLGIFSVALLLNIVTKIIFVTCSEGVKYMIPESLPTKSVFSR